MNDPETDLIPARQEKADSWFTAGKMLSLLFLFILAVYPGIVFGTQAFFYRDAGLYSYPNAWFFRESFWRGELPLWNPLNNCGLPFAAQWNTVVFYPPSLIYVLLPFPWSVNLYLLLHFFFAALGMYFLARHWTANSFAATVAAFAFVFNGLVLHSLMWTSPLAALAWMPWVWLAVERAVREGGRYIFLAGLAGAMQMLASSPEVNLLTWGGLGVFWLVEMIRQRTTALTVFRRLSTVVIIVSGLAAVQLLPFFELVKYSQRTTSFNADMWSMPPWGWANFVVPLFRSTPSVIGVFSQEEQQWTSSYYGGIGTLALMLWACFVVKEARVRVLALTALGALLLAFGQKGFLYGLVEKVAPVLSMVRFPVKFVALVLFIGPLLAAIGLAAWRRQTIPPVQARRTMLGLAVFVAGVIIAVLLAAYFQPFPGDVWNATWKSGASRFALLSVVIVLFLAGRSAASDRNRRLMDVGLVCVIGLDGLTHAPLANPAFPAAAYKPMEFRMTSIPQVGTARAMLSPPVRQRMERSATSDLWTFCLGERSVLLCNCNLLDGIPKIDGLFPIYLRQTTEIENIIERQQAAAGVLDFLGVSQIAQPSQHALFEWRPRTNYAPMITGGQQPEFVEDASILKRLTDPEFDPRRTVFLSDKIGSEVPQQAARIEIQQPNVTAHRLSFEVNADAAGWVVVAQSHYLAWVAYVDGQRTPIFRANHAFQALAVPAGRHQVVMRYEDRPLYVGASISGLTLVICGFGIYRNRKGAVRDSV